MPCTMRWLNSLWLADAEPVTGRALMHTLKVAALLDHTSPSTQTPTLTPLAFHPSYQCNPPHCTRYWPHTTCCLPCSRILHPNLTPPYSAVMDWQGHTPEQQSNKYMSNQFKPGPTCVIGLEVDDSAGALFSARCAGDAQRLLVKRVHQCNLVFWVGGWVGEWLLMCVCVGGELRWRCADTSGKARPMYNLVIGGGGGRGE